MYMIIDMNIYITQENEKNLREFMAWHEAKGHDASMSGLINMLLTEWFKTNPVQTEDK